MPDPNRTAKQKREGRLEFVASLYKRGYSYRQIRQKAMDELGLKTYSLDTVTSDIELLKTEWRTHRIVDTNDAIQLELERIDDAIRELWDAWEKSKTDQDLKSSKKKGVGVPVSQSETGAETMKKIQTKEYEESVKHEICYGDPRYIAEIRAQLVERRKLLGLYAPEKRQITGKDGKDLIPEAAKVNINDFTPEEKAQLLKIARKIDRDA